MMSQVNKIEAVSLAVHSNAVWFTIIRNGKARIYTWFSNQDSISKLDSLIKRFCFMKDELLKRNKQ